MDISKEFKKYFSCMRIPFVNKMQSERNKYEIILNRLYEFYFFTLFIADYLKSENLAFKGQTRVLPTLFSKASLNLFGIYNCLSNGLIVEASTILRSLFETYITTLLILEKDVVKRCKLFCDYQYIVKWKHIVRSEELFKMGVIKSLTFDDSFKIECEENYLKVKENYNPKGQRHWAWKIFKDTVKEPEKFNPTFKYICEYLNKHEEYLRIYTIFSFPVHSTSIIGHQYSEKISGENTIMNVPRFSEEILISSIIALDYSSQIIIKIFKYLKIKDYNQIRDFVKKHYLKTITL